MEGTAKDLINVFFKDKQNLDIIDVEVLMTTFARMHLASATKKICEDVYHNVEIDWVDYHDFSAGHNGTKGDIDYDSIKEAYPLSNIK